MPVQLRHLEIVNFKAITRFRLDDLRDAAVIAGPNGCGKSCVLDAIRLLKSVYGGYQQNEWHNWFGEFQINFNQSPQELLRLLQDRQRELVIEADFAFTPSEKEHLRANATDLLMAASWREVVPELADWRALNTAPLASQYRAHHEEVVRRATEAKIELLGELREEVIRARFRLTPRAELIADPSRLLELAFSRYEPGQIGVLDFHGAHRRYDRERVGGVNLDLTSVENQRRERALYNSQNKYAGLKSEMASMYVRRKLAEEAGSDELAEQADLVDSLRDLFETFFPGKEFLGPQPTTDGGVEFPVRLRDGSVHDLDDLSSGEKEVLYGYVRLRNSGPRTSVILLDEPELHLNPRLLRGLARFYLEHLVAEGQNQLWLITHSDTILREAVNLEGFQVFHMRRGDRSRQAENQASPITTGEEIERLVIELVGDLAAYRPGAKVVLFEGAGDVEFDVRMVQRLFPEFDAAVNTVAAGNKRQVTALHETLDRIGSDTLGARFYAVRDRDSGLEEAAVARQFTWGAYHIENYLLDPEYVYRAVSELSRGDAELTSPQRVDAALRDCARGTVGELVHHELTVHANDLLVRALNVGADPLAQELALAFGSSIAAAVERVNSLGEGELALDALGRFERDRRAERERDLETDAWRDTFRGRDVLRRFVANHVSGTNYEAFRDLVLARMKEQGHQPAGMAEILTAILADEFPMAAASALEATTASAD